MNSIFLTSTRHENLGKCNSDELYKIFEGLKPNVIFEELPPSSFDEFYISKSKANLETDTINKYVQKYKIKHISVDSNNIPSDEFFKDYKNMLSRIEGLADINGFTFRNVMDGNRLNIERHGFDYLNSKYIIDVNKEIDDAIKGGLKKINNEKLFQTYKTFMEINDFRENHMLKQIYGYSKSHPFERAIFTIGSAHRNSIIEKTITLKKKIKN